MISDAALRHLQDVADRPDLSGTPYEIVEAIGRGGMGTVYLARVRDLEREVALKVVSLPEGDSAERLLREARILARLEHPGIVPVHDVGTLPDGRVFYAMKRVRGQRLDEVSFGEVLVMDWGVAKTLTASPEAHGTILGTPGYMAPEQERGEVERIDERTDIWALGAILGFLLTGEETPRPLAAIRRRAMAAEPAERYPKVEELAADLTRYLAGLSVGAYRESLFESTVRFVRRYRTPILLVLAYLVMRALLLIFLGR